MAYRCNRCEMVFAGSSMWAQKGFCPRCKVGQLINSNNPFNTPKTFVPPPDVVPQPNPAAPLRPDGEVSVAQPGGAPAVVDSQQPA